jgi:class 3 adenylate cyclase
MPRYMDRHNIPTATSEDLARAHELDLAVQGQYDTKFLTYWFDPTDGTGICLVEAPDREAIAAVHRAAHGDVPSEIIEVDLATVHAFLGRVGDPEPVVSESGEVVPGAVDSPLRTIMFTDLQDSTSQLQHLGHLRAIEALEEHDRIVTTGVAAHSGAVVKNTGDGFLASFAAVEDALRCAVALQRAIHAHNQSVADVPLHIRVGLNAGLPIDRGGDLFGTAVQLAARVCAEARPDQILAAGVMRDLCSDAELHDGFRDAGRVTLKGFVSAVQLYEVSWRELQPG